MKKIVLAVVLMLGLTMGVSFSADPSFGILPVSGSNLKLYCNYNFNIRINAGGQNFNAFDATLKFNTGEVFLSHSQIIHPLNNSSSGYIVGDLYRSYGALPAGSKSSIDTNSSSFVFRTISNITSTSLNFSNITGGDIVWGRSTTDDGITINGYDVGSEDILTGVNNVTYNMFALPCVVDNTAPSFVNINPINNSRFVSGDQKINLTVYDRYGPAVVGLNNTVHYRYSGLDTVLENYQSAVGKNVDNQYGVDSGTIVLTVTCPYCSSFGGPYILSGSDLNMSVWTGDSSRNRYTRDSRDRGYNLWFDMPADYEIEKQIIITGIALDNPNENGQVHTGSFSLYLNAPMVPIINPLYPTNGAVFVDNKKTNKLRFYLVDDRAGIDTGTIEITIASVWSGSQLLLTGYTYSGSDLDILLSGGSVGLGNAGSYIVEFYPKWDFPSNQNIVITGSVYDLASNLGTLNMSFGTRPSCEFWGCDEIFKVIIMDGNYFGTWDFGGELLIITGTDINSPYPYLTGDDGNILMCGYPYTGTSLQSNLNIYNKDKQIINNYFFTGKELYITGKNFVIQDGIVLID